MPGKTDLATIRRIISLCLRKRLGPVQLAALTAFALQSAPGVDSVRAVRLSYRDRATGEPVRRYADDQHGAMLHVDVSKLVALRPPHVE